MSAAPGHPRRLTLLVSSMSARGRALRAGPGVVAALRAGGWDVDVDVTVPGEDIADSVRRADSALIGALGGDGYLAAVAGAMAGGGRILVPFAGGRGNDLCRSLGVAAPPRERAGELAALGAVPEGRLRPLDGMWVRAADAQPVLALGVLSLGVDAWANLFANRTWLRSGPLAYAWGAFAALARYRPAPLTGLVDGRKRELSGWLCSVSNTGWLGGGINLCPASDPGDGRLEVLHVGRLPLVRVLSALSRVVASRSGNHPLIHVAGARSVRIEGPRSVPAMADGDLVGHLPVDVRVAPNVVRVLA